MKITYTPQGTNDSFIFEGEVAEVLQVIDALVAQPPRSNAGFLTPTPAVSEPKTSKTPAVVSITTAKDQAEKIDKFLSSLYLYAADNTTDTGKGRWIAEKLMTFKTFEIKTLAKSANSTVDTVHNNINRLRKGGAIVNVDDVHGTVTVLSFPENKRFIRKRRTVKQAAKQTPAGPINTDALKGLKLK